MAFLREAAAQLPAGATILLSFFVRDGTRAEVQADWRKRATNSSRIETEDYGWAVGRTVSDPPHQERTRNAEG